MYTPTLSFSLRLPAARPVARTDSHPHPRFRGPVLCHAIHDVHAFQRGMLMMPLSTYPDGAQTLVSARAFGASPGAPPDRVKAMDARAFFAAFATAMKANPPHATDGAMVRDLGRIGLLPGQDFDPSKLTSDQLQALDEVVRTASARLESLVVSLELTTQIPTAPPIWMLWKWTSVAR
jgi:hypothetical protein